MAVSVAVVGATGAVGEIMRQVLAEHTFYLATNIKFLASERSVGKTIEFKGKKIRRRTDPSRSLRRCANRTLKHARFGEPGN